MSQRRVAEWVTVTLAAVALMQGMNALHGLYWCRPVAAALLLGFVAVSFRAWRVQVARDGQPHAINLS